MPSRDCQDNNAYAMFDVEAGQYIFMHGFGYVPMTMDASDKDDSILIKSRWGTTTDQSSCIYDQMDYGGGGICGYAPTLAIYLNDDNGPKPGWFSGDYYIDATLDSAADCQAICATFDGCDYFSYEWEYDDDDAMYYNECFLKAGFSDPTCHGFVLWGFDDTYAWKGASGYGVCPDQTPAYGMFMPDVVKSITIGGEYYFLTANEGGGRDGEDMIGMAPSGDPELEGEEIRLKDVPTVTCGGDPDCTDSGNLGRVKTTVFIPSNYATSAAGDNQVNASDIWKATYPNPAYNGDVDCIYEKYDYGGGSDSTCGSYAPMVAIILNDASAGFPGWFSGDKIVDNTTLNSAADCQRWCSIYDGCDFFSCVDAASPVSLARGSSPLPALSQVRVGVGLSRVLPQVELRRYVVPRLRDLGVLRP